MKLDSIFDSMRKARQKDEEIKKNRYLKLKQWWENFGSLLFVEKDILGLAKHGEEEEVKNSLLREMKMRNMGN